MTIQELFIASNQALLRVVSQIKDDQWELSVPEGMASEPSTLKETIQYHTYDDAWVPDVLAGKTTDEVGAIYEHLLTDENVQANYQKYNLLACEAMQNFDDLDSTIHFSYGDFPAREGLRHITSFRAFRSYDLAKLIGVDATMDDELVQALLQEFTPEMIEGYRQMGIFPAALEVPEDATPQAKLLAMVGRS